MTCKLYTQSFSAHGKKNNNINTHSEINEKTCITKTNGRAKQQEKM